MVSQPPKPSMPPGTQFGDYRLVKLIAVGGMAEIYLATAPGVDGFERKLALKVIHPEYADDKTFVQMLVDEAKLSVTLNHTNIVQTFDLEQIGKAFFISMEFVDGADFFQILQRVTSHDQDLPIPAALFVACEALAGLDYAHSTVDAQGKPMKIIHRDISPQNILLSRSGQVKLVDFGIAKAANLSTKTRAGVIKGKLVYMSPEQSWGDPVDQRTDIFSAGVVLYEALTGGSLYVETNPVKLLQLVRKAEIPPPSTIRREIPARLDELVMRALAPRPADRYQSAREFNHALASYLSQHAPDYGAAALGTLVQRVLGPDGVREQPRAPREQAASMNRKDFAVKQDSVIFSAEEMMAEADAEPTASRESPVPKRDDGVMAKLMLLEEDGTKTFDIDEQFVIGRGGDLRLTDGRVSRRHARIVAHEGGYLLEDLKSSNGTYLNEEKVAEIQRLAHGDRIRIGPFQMQFVLEQPASLPVPLPQPVLAPEPLPSRPPPPPQRVAPPPPRPAPPQRAAPPPRPSVPPSVSAPPPPSIAPPPPRPSALPSTTPRQNEVLPAADLTAKQQRRGGCMTVRLGEETISVPVNVRLPLGQRISAGSTTIDGPSSLVVRRGDAYWIEPVPHRDAVRVNGQPIERPVQLAVGDKVLVGALQLEFALQD